MYYTYMIRCEDNSIYTGITTDLERRIKEHMSKNEKCAKYTKRHNAKKLETAWITENRVLASKLEYQIKKNLTKKQKEDLIINHNLNIFKDKIEENLYINIDNYKKKEEKMSIIYKRKINYYETDRMGIVHHSNYIRFLEEARCYMLDKIGYPYSKIEENGLMIPVLGVKCEYKHHVTFEDIIEIEVYVKEFTGVKMIMGYNVINKSNREKVIEAETKHCFTNNNLKPISLKKYNVELYEKLKELEK